MRQLFISAGLFVYLVVTLSALSYTLTRWSLFPKDVIWFSYGMMAPFQGYIEENGELVAEGYFPLHAGESQGEGRWERINLATYIPTGLGERVYRGSMPSVRRWFPEMTADRYRSFASQILQKEQGRGIPYTELRLSLSYWPRSPEGFHALDVPVFQRREIITTVP